MKSGAGFSCSRHAVLFILVGFVLLFAAIQVSCSSENGTTESSPSDVTATATRLPEVPAAVGGCTIEPGAECPGADFRGADLSEVKPGMGDTREQRAPANLKRANLRGADFAGANLTLVRLEGADLREANLRDATIQAAFLYQADLRGADLSGADLGRADLDEAQLDGAIFCDTIMPDGTRNNADCP